MSEKSPQNELDEIANIIFSDEYNIDYKAEQFDEIYGLLNHSEYIGYQQCLDDLQQFLDKYAEAWINTPVAVTAIQRRFIDKKKE
jgi:hypothetical protein